MCSLCLHCPVCSCYLPAPYLKLLLIKQSAEQMSMGFGRICPENVCVWGGGAGGGGCLLGAGDFRDGVSMKVP